MTRSILDPTGDETERGRSRFLGPAPTQHSKMPPAAIDGKDESRDEEDETKPDAPVDIEPDQTDVA
ncbi:MAG TPA: hypothetical protein VGR35_05435 [Tepidisphaeraceae bacterium]|nr:hypothetical protein [Tepidisphaeraceae bacterium]